MNTSLASGFGANGLAAPRLQRLLGALRAHAGANAQCRNTHRQALQAVSSCLMADSSLNGLLMLGEFFDHHHPGLSLCLRELVRQGLQMHAGSTQVLTLVAQPLLVLCPQSFPGPCAPVLAHQPSLHRLGAELKARLQVRDVVMDSALYPEWIIDYSRFGQRPSYIRRQGLGLDTAAWVGWKAREALGQWRTGRWQLTYVLGVVSSDMPLCGPDGQWHAPHLPRDLRADLVCHPGLWSSGVPQGLQVEPLPLQLIDKALQGAALEHRTRDLQMFVERAGSRDASVRFMVEATRERRNARVLAQWPEGCLLYEGPYPWLLQAGEVLTKALRQALGRARRSTDNCPITELEPAAFDQQLKALQPPEFDARTPLAWWRMHRTSMPHRAPSGAAHLAVV